VLRHYQRLLAAMASNKKLMRAWDAAHPVTF